MEDTQFPPKESIIIFLSSWVRWKVGVRHTLHWVGQNWAKPHFEIQNHASDVIFCDHASDVQYESGYVVPLALEYLPLMQVNTLYWWRLSSWQVWQGRRNHLIRKVVQLQQFIGQFVTPIGNIQNHMSWFLSNFSSIPFIPFQLQRTHWCIDLFMCSTVHIRDWPFMIWGRAQAENSCWGFFPGQPADERLFSRFCPSPPDH